jgi:glutaredoxin 3
MGPAPVVIYTKTSCGFCSRARALFTAKGVAFTEINVEQISGARDEMRLRSGRNTLPQIFIGERHVGGYDDANALEQRGELDPLLAATA